MKRFLTVVFFTLAIYPIVTTRSYGEPLVHVVFPQTTPIAVGERLNVEIHIADAQGVVGYELTIGFDPTVLRYIGGGNADYLPEGAFTLTPVVRNNAVYIAATSVIGAAADSEGRLATLTFEVVAAKASTLELRQVILSDTAGMPLSVATREGRLETVESLRIGDVNGDRSVNILDLTLVASNLRGGTPTTPRADVNADGTVNILDMVLVAQHLDVARRDKPRTEVKVIPVVATHPAVVDDILRSIPANFVHASPPGGSITQNTRITLTFDAPPSNVSVSAGTVVLSGKKVFISGPFTPGPLNLKVTWADGWHHFAYFVIPPDTQPPSVTGGNIRDGDVDVDSEAINSDAKIEITFSEPVSGNIALQTEDGDDVGWLGTVEGRTATLELVAGKALHHSRTTYVIVGKVSDPAGNETDIEIIFETRAVPFFAFDIITALWFFDEGKGNRVSDTSGEGLDGRIDADARWVIGKFGRALQFAGQGQGVVFENSAFNFEEGMTVTGWFYPNAAVTNRPLIEQDGSFYIGFNHAGVLEFVIQPDDTTFVADFPFNNALRRWHHFAVTFDRNGTTFYINGDRNTWWARENNVPIAPSAADLVIGAGFAGIIDEIAFFNKALTEDAIIEVMNGFAGLFGEE